MEHNKVAKQKIRTLCTIDTSDIELNDFRNNNHKRSSKERLNRYHSKFNYKMAPTTVTPHNLKHSQSSNHAKNKKSLTKKMSSTIHPSRVMTEYSYGVDSSFKTMTQKFASKESIISHRSLSLVKKKVQFHKDDHFRTDAYELIRKMASSKQQKVSLVRRDGVVYLLKKTKDTEMKKQYLQEEQMKEKMANMKGRNLMKLFKSYHQKPWLYLLYEYPGDNFSWQKSLHRQIVNKVMKSQGLVLLYYVKELAKAINELSAKGYVHGRLCLENTFMKVTETAHSVKVQGNIKLGNLGQCFHIKNKSNFLTLPDSIYTPPEIINYKVFERKENFDRKLIECISVEDKAWYIDVWALGILTLELIAGEPINLQKVVNSPKKPSFDSESEQGEVQKDILLVDDEITLVDILLAQKNLLYQTQTQIQAISFNPKLQSLLTRMLSVNPLQRPSPKEIIGSLGNTN